MKSLTISQLISALNEAKEAVGDAEVFIAVTKSEAPQFEGVTHAIPVMAIHQAGSSEGNKKYVAIFAHGDILRL